MITVLKKYSVLIVCLINLNINGIVIANKSNLKRNNIMVFSVAIAAIGLALWKKEAIYNFFKKDEPTKLSEDIKKNITNLKEDKSIELKDKDKKEDKSIELKDKDKKNIINDIEKQKEEFEQFIENEQSNSAKNNKDSKDLKDADFNIKMVEKRIVGSNVTDHFYYVYKVIDGKQINCGPLMFFRIFKTVKDIENLVKNLLNNKDFIKYFKDNNNKLTYKLRFDDTATLKDQKFDDYIFIQVANNYDLRGNGGAQEGASRKNNIYVEKAWSVLLKNHNNFNFRGVFHLFDKKQLEGYQIEDTEIIKNIINQEPEIVKYMYTENREMQLENGQDATLFASAALSIPKEKNDSYKNAVINITKMNHYSIILQALIKSYELKKPIKILFTSLGTALFNNPYAWHEEAFKSAFKEVYELLKSKIGEDFNMPLYCERIVYKENNSDKYNMSLASKPVKEEYQRTIDYLALNCNFKK